MSIAFAFCIAPSTRAEQAAGQDVNGLVRPGTCDLSDTVNLT